jgi:hypothetical protein
MFCHVALTGGLYALLTIMRAPSVWNISVKNSFTQLEARVSANLSNQFEWPLFFYAACIILLTNEQLYSASYLWLAWVFIIGRIVHSLVHIATSNIRLRGIVFTINFLAVFGMWVRLLLDSV